MTEVHYAEGRFVGRKEYPPVMGHEFGGVVDALGAGVEAPRAGTAVACHAWGGYAEQVVLAADRVFPLPPGIPVEQAAFVEPLVCCTIAMKRAALPVGSTVLTVGAGPMGLLMLELARCCGAVAVVVSEPNPERRALALRLGAERSVDPRSGGLREAVADVTGGRGVDVAFEVVGHPAALADCVESVSDGGTVVVMGVGSVGVRMDVGLYDLQSRHLTIKGSSSRSADVSYPAAMRWMGRLDLGALISHRFDLAEISRAFDVARAGEGVKVLVGSGW